MTLDEAAKRHANSGWKMLDGTQEPVINHRKWASFVSGANWNEEQNESKFQSLLSQIKGLRAFFFKGSPVTNMLDKIIKDHEV